MKLILSGITKTFPGQVALRGVDLSVTYGEVHALVGQNGSGKSTLIKILSGYHEPDPGGSAELDGARFTLGSADLADAAGLRFVHQDLGLVLSLSVLDNVLLGREYPTGRLGQIRWPVVQQQVGTYLRQLGVDVDPRTAVGDLSLAERAGVAIARAVSDTSDHPMAIVLDEPTAALPPDEVRRLLEILDRLRRDGHAVLLVTHHLGEVLEVADRVTVLRDGRVVASAPRAEFDHDKLASLIVGETIVSAVGGPGGGTIREQAGGDPASEADPVLETDNVSGGRVRRLDLAVRRCEIVGIAGITGSGRESVAPLLTGRLGRRGEMRVNGRTLPPGDPSEALGRGVAQVAGERARYGLFPNLSLRGNLTISDLGRHRRHGRISAKGEQAETADWIRRLNIAATGTDVPIMTLSGGNQQKVLIGRALRLDPSLLVLDDPTMGIDIGARAQVHKIVEDCAENGMAIVLVSTDSDELARLADRVLVMKDGIVAEQLDRGPALTADAIDMTLARGVGAGPGAAPSFASPGGES
ncbi:MAG TPA: sugar ABC transporter ATP-binding protein [Trebonia sp.]|jgi:ribose transport system ATP-binding protein|nr:sugar ABC transporter ATP-binding protein [Trebonia sp.]